ncbi:MAG: DNA-binding protein [Xenococcaceae cyanobacterium]
MSRDRRLEIRLTEKEYQKLKANAELDDVSMAQVLRWCIKSLPDAKTLASTSR